jgi:hypothetical protein
MQLAPIGKGTLFKPCRPKLTVVAFAAQTAARRVAALDAVEYFLGIAGLDLGKSPTLYGSWPALDVNIS